MNIASRERVKEIVFNTIRSLMRKSDLAIEEKDSINFSTPLYGDDFGNLFIVEVEDSLRVRVPARDWSMVYTVGDAIDLLVRRIGSV